jgi:hypothetical protein
MSVSRTVFACVSNRVSVFVFHSQLGASHLVDHSGSFICVSREADFLASPQQHTPDTELHRRCSVICSRLGCISLLRKLTGHRACSDHRICLCISVTSSSQVHRNKLADSNLHQVLTLHHTPPDACDVSQAGQQCHYGAPDCRECSFSDSVCSTSGVFRLSRSSLSRQLHRVVLLGCCDNGHVGVRGYQAVHYVRNYHGDHLPDCWCGFCCVSSSHLFMLQQALALSRG